MSSLLEFNVSFLFSFLFMLLLFFILSSNFLFPSSSTIELSLRTKGVLLLLLFIPLLLLIYVLLLNNKLESLFIRLLLELIKFFSEKSFELNSNILLFISLFILFLFLLLYSMMESSSIYLSLLFSFIISKLFLL